MRAEWDEIERHNREAKGRSQRLLVLGALAIVAFFAWKHFSGKLDSMDTAEPAPEAAIVEPTVIEPPRLIEAPAPQYLSPPPARTGRESYVGVYECVENGQRVISDRPCSSSAQARTLVVDQPDPRDVARQRQQQWQAQQQAGQTYSAPRGTSQQLSAGPASAPANESACAYIDQQIDWLNARMRQKYSSQEGEYLRDQLRALKERRYDLRCGR